MNEIMDAIRHILHEQYFEHAEEWVVEKTNPIYRAMIFSLIAFMALVTFGTILNVKLPAIKMINALFGCVSFITLTMVFLYGRHIFKLICLGTAHGVAKSGRSGLAGGEKILKSWFWLYATLSLIYVGVFGVLSFINFTWFSAGLCVFVGIMIGLSQMREKLS